MGIKISNFSPVWEFVQPNVAPIPTNPVPQFYNGAFMFVTFQVNTATSAQVQAQVWDKMPETVDNVYNGAVMIANLNFGNMPVNVQGNILLDASNAIVEALQLVNPKVKFEVIGLNA
jgi:hypothetical protein